MLSLCHWWAVSPKLPGCDCASLRQPTFPCRAEHLHPLLQAQTLCSLAGRGIPHNSLPSLFPHFDQQDGAQGLPLTAVLLQQPAITSHLLQGRPVPHPPSQSHTAAVEKVLV